MVDYYFDFDEYRSENHAETDPVGGGVRIFLQTFQKALPHLYPHDLEQIIIYMLEEVFIHEQIHYEIAQEVDTTGEQEHSTIYEGISTWLNSKSDVGGY